MRASKYSMNRQVDRPSFLSSFLPFFLFLIHIIIVDFFLSFICDMTMGLMVSGLGLL